MKAIEKIAALRKLMKKMGIQAYLIPSTDPHQSEYVPDFWRRREWISGFTGSAGDVLITLDKAAMWTDSRYFLQAEQQLAGSGIKLMRMGEPQTPTFSDWLTVVLKKGSKVGVDPQVMSCKQFQNLHSHLREHEIALVTVKENLVDELWTDRPLPPEGPIQIHAVKYAGETYPSKLKRLRKEMATADVKAHVISTLDSIAWLFNIRGTDVAYNPLVIACALVTDKHAILFTDLHKVTPKLQAYFGSNVECRAYHEFPAALRQLAKSKLKVWVDGSTANQQMMDLLSRGCDLVLKESPIVMFKAVKNPVQIEGAQQAHIQDGVAMVKFLCWLEKTIGKEKITEISAADKLEEFRSERELFRGLSFDTIAGYGAHGAIIHYSSTPETNVKLKPKGIFLLDSGGQYENGTTDITRTIALSPPTPEQKDRCTRVLKGHIQLALASFPAGTTGKQLDAFARRPLWEAGLNYAHGTGHGVGSYLSVHEGPHRISPAALNEVALVPGMVMSNEPGYYKTGAYGLRLENLVYVIEDKKRSKHELQFLTFETLTLCPFDRKLIDKKLLTKEEIVYLNEYHARVRKTLTRYLDKAEALWLEKATRPV